MMGPMAPRTYSFSELAEHAGIPERQLRTYLTRGLIPRSDRRGRGARYSQEALDRLLVITRIRTQAPPGTTLDQVAELLEQLDPDMITAIADGRIPFQLIDDGRPEARVAHVDRFQERTDAPPVASFRHRGDAPGESASRPPKRAHVVRLHDGESSGERPGDPVRLAAGAGRRPTVRLDASSRRSTAARQLDELVQRLQHAEQVLGAGGQSRVEVKESETWHRIAAGRDLEIHARGPLSEEDLELLQEAARLMRSMLRGPSGHHLDRALERQRDADRREDADD